MRPVGDEPERPTSAVGIGHLNCLLLADGPQEQPLFRVGLGPWAIQWPCHQL